MQPGTIYTKVRTLHSLLSASALCTRCPGWLQERMLRKAARLDPGSYAEQLERLEQLIARSAPAEPASQPDSPFRCALAIMRGGTSKNMAHQSAGKAGKGAMEVL